jgi:hypothetical protein
LQIIIKNLIELHKCENLYNIPFFFLGFPPEGTNPKAKVKKPGKQIRRYVAILHQGSALSLRGHPPGVSTLSGVLHHYRK